MDSSHMAKQKTKMRKRMKSKKLEGNSSLSYTAVSFSILPEGCIVEILARMNPRDACRMSVLATIFLSAAGSDALWERFLPVDYLEILNRSVEPSSRLNFSSKRELFFNLCDSPLLIDGGKMSFWLEKQSGKKCYVLAARELTIIWGNTPEYWIWPSLTESRFSEVAYLLEVRRFEIRGKINTCMLSSGTNYAAYLVFDTSEAYGFEDVKVKSSIGIIGGEITNKTIYLDVYDAEEYDTAMQEPQAAVGCTNSGYIYPKTRKDMWLEVELGEFFNEGEEDVELEMTVTQLSRHLKHGLIVEGIEIRPKDDL